MSFFCQSSSLAQFGSLPIVDLPASSTHLAPYIGPKFAGVFEYQPMFGLKPTTFSDPSGLRTVSFFAYSVSSEIVFGGPSSPGFLSMSWLTYSPITSASIGSAQRLPSNCVYERGAGGKTVSLIPSRFMYGARSIHAPEPQNAPALSAENDWATSGAFPPRLAATILSSLMPPTTLTWTPAFSASKSFTTPLITPSSRCVKPTHSVMSAGSSLAGLAPGVL